MQKNKYNGKVKLNIPPTKAMKIVHIFPNLCHTHLHQEDAIRTTVDPPTSVLNLLIKNDKDMSPNYKRGTMKTFLLVSMRTEYRMGPPSHSKEWQYDEHNFLCTFHSEWFNNCLLKIFCNHWNSHEHMYVDKVCITSHG